MMRTVLDTGWRSLLHFDEELCGDRVIMRRGGSDFVAVLADGLGSGVKANILSTMTGTILSTMVAGDAEVETAVETVVKSLPVSSDPTLSYCTFTVVKVSPGGEAVFVEYDNPPAWIIRGRQVFYPHYRTRLMSGKRIRESVVQLVPGDLVVVTSDGAINAGADNIFNMDWTWDSLANWLCENGHLHSSARRLAYALTEKINDLYFGQPADDTTAMVIRVPKETVVSLMFGPPANQADDGDMVKDFLSQGDVKIVCGGTTAKVVSRITGREIVPLEQGGGDVPPISFMEGIDLVTEGSVTMGRALEIVRDYFQDEIRQDFSALDRPDGAAALAKLLAEDCTHLRLLLGGARNPAYKDDARLDVTRKIRLAEELTGILKDNGRKVEITYYR